MKQGLINTTTSSSKWLRVFTALAMLVQYTLLPNAAQANMMTYANMPKPGEMVGLTEAYLPPMLHGITIDPANPFKFDFLVASGDEVLSAEDMEYETERLIKYFLTALTVPEEDMWVNLSPHEDDRIIPDKFGMTEMGRELLAQDYLLKQLTSSLMFPETEVGAEFWDEVYTRVYEETGQTDVPVNTFNKVWIMPKDVKISEVDNSAFVVDTQLTVLLEEDLVALDHGRYSEKFGSDETDEATEEELNNVSGQVVKEIILPIIEKEVNEGKSFAKLRQIMNSVILASWFKSTLKNSILGHLVMNKNEVDGISLTSNDYQDKIYNDYVEAYQKGVYDLVKEEYDPITQTIVPRKYFAGGAEPGKILVNLPDGTTESVNLSSGYTNVPPDQLQAFASLIARMGTNQMNSTTVSLDTTLPVDTEVIAVGYQAMVNAVNEIVQANSTQSGAVDLFEPLLNARIAAIQDALGRNDFSAEELEQYSLTPESFADLLAEEQGEYTVLDTIRLEAARVQQANSDTIAALDLGYGQTPVQVRPVTADVGASTGTSIQPAVIDSQRIQEISLIITPKTIPELGSPMLLDRLGNLANKEVRTQNMKNLVDQPADLQNGLQSDYTESQAIKNDVANYLEGVSPATIAKINEEIDQVFANAQAATQPLTVHFRDYVGQTVTYNDDSGFHILLPSSLFDQLKAKNPEHAAQMFAIELAGEIPHTAAVATDDSTAYQQDVDGFVDQLELQTGDALFADDAAYDAFLTNVLSIIETKRSLMDDFYLMKRDRMRAIDNAPNKERLVALKVAEVYTEYAGLTDQMFPAQETDQSQPLTFNDIYADIIANNPQVFTNLKVNVTGEYSDLTTLATTIDAELAGGNTTTLDQLAMDLTRQFLALNNDQFLNGPYAQYDRAKINPLEVPVAVMTAALLGLDDVTADQDQVDALTTMLANPESPLSQLLYNGFFFSSDELNQPLAQTTNVEGKGWVQGRESMEFPSNPGNAFQYDPQDQTFIVSNVGGILLDLSVANIETIRRGNRIEFDVNALEPIMKFNFSNTVGFKSINIINVSPITPAQFPMLFGLDTSADDQPIQVSKS
jgi:hypothetical protein